MEKVLYKIYVRGRVQGVGFRYSAVRAANHHGITGFVKNMPDGSVYMEAEGTEKELLDFIEWCRNGPGHVGSLTIDPYPPRNYVDFRIVF
ncbi:MAG TPA: acylphosphatase [Bacteroidales bacterium]|jgi:acylphosphatase|nr:acylphosphatase [Bacteroidales bacterium]HNR40986.1 acylphosphatase [Bacteroidales bacterium]HPM18159.1 acylphosphatase [Bacteroidales bacterium]HQG78410.1 acylphosphatase [Bacteroidales bacterium]